jgi:hypothetical protein
VFNIPIQIADGRKRLQISNWSSIMPILFRIFSLLQHHQQQQQQPSVIHHTTQQFYTATLPTTMDEQLLTIRHHQQNPPRMLQRSGGFELVPSGQIVQQQSQHAIMGDIQQNWRKRPGVYFGYMIFIPFHKAKTSSVSFLLILVNKTQYMFSSPFSTQ